MNLNSMLLMDFIKTSSSKLFYTIVIIIACVIAIKVSSRISKALLNSRFAISQHINQKKAATLASVTESVVKYVIIFIGICSILIHFGVPQSTLAAVMGTGTVAIGLGAQSLIKDTLAGFFIIFENQFNVGDLIEAEGISGFVEDISIRTTQIRGFDGTLHIIPNGVITIVSNMTKSYINATVDITVSYDEDLERVIEILDEEMEIAAKEVSSLKGKPTVFGVTAFDESGATIRTVGECVVKEGGKAERELRLRIKKRFDAENIKLAVPQRIIHIEEKK